jgi:hypothetical protein
MSQEAISHTENIINRTLQKEHPPFTYEVGDLLEAKTPNIKIQKVLVLECTASWIDKLAMWSANYKLLDLQTEDIVSRAKLTIENHYIKIA